MSGHTPGPWFILDGTDVVLRDNEQELRGYGLTLMSYDDDDDGEADARSIADARLISAAPDLLEALQGLAEWVLHHSRYPDLCEPLKVARAAIAKATQTDEVSL